VGPLAHRRYVRAPRTTGVGMFAGLVQVQDPSRMIGRNLLASLSDQPGIRLAQATGRRVYFGTTAHQPQRFVVPSNPNRADQLRAGLRGSGNARRSLGRQRGLAPLGVQYAA
jgi:hypothetical protein